MSEERPFIETDVFIPEQYVKHNEFLMELHGHGWGIRIPAQEIGEAIQSGRIAPEVVANRAFIVIY